MGIVTRFLKRIDENLIDLDQPLAVVIPHPRQFEVAGYWSHCCCPPGCTDLHRDRCDHPDGVA